MLMLWKIVPVFTIGETLEGDYTKDSTQGDEACYVFKEWHSSRDQEWYANFTCAQHMTDKRQWFRGCEGCQ
jgi:hypothetical protein